MAVDGSQNLFNLSGKLTFPRFDCSVLLILEKHAVISFHIIYLEMIKFFTNHSIYQRRYCARLFRARTNQCPCNSIYIDIH